MYNLNRIKEFIESCFWWTQIVLFYGKPTFLSDACPLAFFSSAIKSKLGLDLLFDFKFGRIFEFVEDAPFDERVIVELKWNKNIQLSLFMQLWFLRLFINLSNIFCLGLLVEYRVFCLYLLHFYIRQKEDMFSRPFTCLFVCMSVNNLGQKLFRRFPWNLCQVSQTIKARTD